ncbi:flagellar motor switch protein FliN/FliY [Proteiniborus ethanoligenes]|uniref:Flagellar motor switch protein FliN/FliY n=1 Tax=Proteiniborus ethanoligenes TaxID=415015 RepID=A0A1H3PPV7_9FIRM|nr:flagellar motor switch phosphatase FliY [Proteiniborus ethanoligenes]TAH63133.1 MAG: flagellar motor switch phosphatase FliY [Gottschalkiaceae bacterium]SDZ02981.1 flagellar motor switch protein FliN/FliY [Proteiniborus ethanoligenes]
MTDNMLSQEEIDMLLKGNYDSVDEDVLDDIEKDALGEIGNISMGTAATTLFTLLGQKVTITTPKVIVTTLREIADQYSIPFVAVDVKYKVGLEGANLLILKSDDVKVITDLMMGGDGKNINRDINEMDISAISEAMNQMVGSSCTSLSEMFSNLIDIEPPRAFQINLHENDFNLDNFGFDEPIVKVSFKMVVGDLIDSEIMQLIPLNFARNMVNKLLGKSDIDEITHEIQYEKEDLSYAPHKMQPEQNAITNSMSYSGKVEYDNHVEKMNNVKQNPVNVKKLELQQFETSESKVYNESIEMIQEIPIEITVELGRTTRKISEILEYGPGTIIELDKLLGEPLEIFANGKFIAKGEVVVIDDNFGVRITDIINPSKRISKN